MRDGIPAGIRAEKQSGALSGARQLANHVMRRSKTAQARVSLLPYCTGRAHLTHPETKQTAPGESNSSCPHARIWHWHGIKPWDVDCWFRRIEQLRPPPPDPYSAGMSAGRPLQGLEMRHALVRTGCRWTAQRTPPCYLVAFAHLLAAFKAFAAAAAE